MASETAIRAARMIKVLNLVVMPGVDEVAVKLNCHLTYNEEREAEMWERALALASEHGDEGLFKCAARLKEEMKIR